MKKYLAIASIMVICMTGSNICVVASQEPNAGTVPITMFLVRTCPSLGCHVTFEDCEGTRLINAQIPDRRNVKSIKGLVEFLRKSLDHASVSVSSNNIVNIRDANLADESSYALDKKMSLSYSGKLVSLPDAIGSKSNGSVRAASSFSISMIDDYDFTTSISLKAEDETVRAILTNHIHTNDYLCILWTAETYARNGKEITYVSFWRPLSGSSGKSSTVLQERRSSRFRRRLSVIKTA